MYSTWNEESWLRGLGDHWRLKSHVLSSGYTHYTHCLTPVEDMGWHTVALHRGLVRG